MLLDNNIEPCCGYCRHGTSMGNNEVICIKRGIMESSGNCNSFRYEPTKRVPDSTPVFTTSELSEEDFTI